MLIVPKNFHFSEVNEYVWILLAACNDLLDFQIEITSVVSRDLPGAYTEIPHLLESQGNAVGGHGVPACRVAGCPAPCQIDVGFKTIRKQQSTGFPVVLIL